MLDRTVATPDALPGLIGAITSELKYAYDIAPSPASTRAVYDALAPGGTLVSFMVDPAQFPGSGTDAASKKVVAVYGSFTMPTQHALGVGLYANLETLLEAGELKVRVFILFRVDW